LNDEGYGSPSQDPSLTSSCRLEPVGIEIWELAQLSDSNILRAWESVGSLDASREKSILTETSSDCVLKVWKSVMGQTHLCRDLSRASHKLCTYITLSQLVNDVKFLLLGMPSQTFQFNEKKDGFELKNTLSTKGLTPGTLQYYCQDFILAGSCCLRLDRLISGRSPQEGLMFQALCSSLRQYLHLYRCAVLKMQECSTLLDLRHQFDGLCMQITSLALLCKVHPQLQEECLPEGVALLAYLYKEIQKVTWINIACILYSVLQACCQVYFSFLQKWLFEGVCHDTYSEFFIQECLELVTNRQREYWSHGHTLLVDAVPGFLHGLEQSIYQCGKALNLLKLCNSQDPLCVMLQSGYPNISCCLHEVELNKMKAEWCSYQLRAKGSCGEPIKIHKLLYQSVEDELLFQAAVQASQMERQRILKYEREMERAAADSEKRKQLMMLKEQIQEAEEMRKRERRERIEEDERIAKEAKQQAEKEAALLELEKANLKKHYDLLSEFAEKRRTCREINTRDEDYLDSSKNEIDNISNSNFEASSNETDKNNGNLVSINNSANNFNLESVNNEIDKNNPADNDFPSEFGHSDVTQVQNIVCYEELKSSRITHNMSTAVSATIVSCFHDCQFFFSELQATSSTPYTLLTSLAENPLVNISDNQVTFHRSAVPPVKDASINMSFISINLQKCILVPLKIQAELVNNALLKLFLEKEDLLSHLHSLRSYFFLIDGEFGRNVTGALFEHMYHASAPADMLNSVVLNSLLYKSLPQTDPNAERLRFHIKYTPSHFTFSSPQSLDCIMLQYKVGWPLNVILTPAALGKYNDVFGFLLRLRRISWVLEEDFHRMKRQGKQIPKIMASPQYHRLQLYRHEMTHFIHAIQSYVTASVLQASWAEFLKNLEHARTLDDVYRTHVAYVKTVLFRLFRCLLNKQSAAIQKALVDTLRMVLKFHGQLCSGTWELMPGATYYQHPKFNTLVQIYQSFHNLAIFVFKFATKLANTGYQPHLFDLLQMLNMNDFYP
ncbi:hypothetical protein L9F63_019536, partial [Diploptera punctata]